MSFTCLNSDNCSVSFIATVLVCLLPLPLSAACAGMMLRAVYRHKPPVSSCSHGQRCSMSLQTGSNPYLHESQQAQSGKVLSHKCGGWLPLSMTVLIIWSKGGQWGQHVYFQTPKWTA